MFFRVINLNAGFSMLVATGRVAAEHTRGPSTVMSLQTPPRIAGVLGHTVRGVTQRYVHLDRALVVVADRVAAAIAQLLNGETQLTTAGSGLVGDEFGLNLKADSQGLASQIHMWTPPLAKRFCRNV